MDRRRERSGQHSSRDSDGSVVAVELTKSTKRGGSLASGNSEVKSSSQSVSNLLSHLYQNFACQFIRHLVGVSTFLLML